MKFYLKYLWRNAGIRTFVLNSRAMVRFVFWLVKRSQVSVSKTQYGVLIIPSDPYLLDASVGDQAMIGSIIDYWKSQRPEEAITFAVADEIAARAASNFGATSTFILGPYFSVGDAINFFKKQPFHTTVLMGADGVDGSYDPSFSVAQLMMADLAARVGSKVIITGFSVSKNFNYFAKKLFQNIHSSVRVNLRDPVSFDRFKQNCTTNCNLVTDVAFLLQPKQTEQIKAVEEWVAQNKKQGNCVIGVNAHPLLLELNERNKLNELVVKMSAVLFEIARKRKIAFVFICHDARGDSSDNHVLEPLYHSISNHQGVNACYPSITMRAREIKWLCSKLDGVITGRMHLMIASVGVATPVLGINYKDKMEGLLELAGLRTDNLLNANILLTNQAESIDRILSFLDELDLCKEKMLASKKKIYAMSLSNFGDVS